MKVHEYAIEGPFRHQVLVYCAIGCVTITGFVSTWISAHKNHPLLALIPAPSALALLWLSYSILWGHFLWRLSVFQKLHKVPVFNRKYLGLSRSNDSMPPRRFEFTVHQTWTSMIISYESSLMEGHSITATVFPDTSRVIAILELKPRNVFDEAWLRAHAISQDAAYQFSLPQQLVVEFRFTDGTLSRARWYTSLKENHLGEFYDFQSRA